MKYLMNTFQTPKFWIIWVFIYFPIPFGISRHSVLIPTRPQYSCRFVADKCPLECEWFMFFSGQPANVTEKFSQMCCETLSSYFGFSGLGPKEVREWPLVNNGYHILYLVLFYCGSVLVLTQIMKKREKPFELKNFSQFHNLCMVILALYMGVEYIRLAIRDGVKFAHNEVRSDDGFLEHARIQYIFFLSKIPEWNDTFIMILKKNFRQVSVLHLWHHSSVFIFSFMAMRSIPGGDPWLAACINSWVHVIMYSYYFCAPLAKESKPNPIVLMFIKMKKMITIGQLVQFFIVFSRDSYILFSYYYLKKPWCDKCGPVFMYWTDVGYMLIMIALFMNFFVNSYSSDKKKIKNL